MNTREKYGDHITLCKLIDGTLDEYEDSNLTNISNYYMFYGNENLIKVKLPKVTSLPDSVFGYCTALSELYLPLVTVIPKSMLEYSGLTNFSSEAITEIKEGGFRSAVELKTISLPNITTIGAEAFYNCTKLESVSLSPSITSISKSCFSMCTSLTSFNGQNITTLNDRCFYESGITNIDFPNATHVGSYAFFNCLNIENVNLPKAEVISSNVFTHTSGRTSNSQLTKLTFPALVSANGGLINLFPKLKIIDFGAVEKFDSYVLYTNTGHLTVVIRTQNTVPVLNANSININKSYTEFDFYVPNDLVDDYKSATNWSVYANQIHPLSELPSEEEET